MTCATCWVTSQREVRGTNRTFGSCQVPLSSLIIAPLHARSSYASSLPSHLTPIALPARVRTRLAEATLLVLGNLVSDSVDPGSAATKIALLQSENAAAALIACLDDIDDAQTLAFAVGCLQNLCHDREWSVLLVAQHVHTTLEALLMHADPFVVRYASGALKNMSVTLQEKGDLFSQRAAAAVTERSRSADVEEFRYRTAAARIVKAINNMPPDIRLRRLLKAKERQSASASGQKQPAGSAAAASRLNSAAERTAARRGASGSRHSVGSGAGSSASSSRRPHVTTPPKPGSHSPPASEASSSHSGSTAYYSVASSVSASKIAQGAAPPAAPPACFEV